MEAQIGLKLNVEYVVRDSFGNIKQTFQENALADWLMKNNILSPKFWKIPFLLGHWTDKAVRSNLVTNAGFAGMAGLANGVVTDFFDYIGVGTGTTAAAAADTTLETELATSGLSRALATLTRVTTTVTDDTAQFLKSFSVTGTQAVTESGVLSASSGGTLFTHQVFSAINVVNGDTLEITWKVKVA